MAPIRKTYWHLGANHRLPSDYEIATTRLLYHVERGGFAVELPTSGFHARHQRGSPLASERWEDFADPRGTIVIDDAKTFFATRNRHYDILISEPSNPWVSGVSSLFTREFYQRIRGHLNPGGILVQWFQLYEIDASLVASVMGALGEVFPHYAVFAPSDHDLLIMASSSESALGSKGLLIIQASDFCANLSTSSPKRNAFCQHPP